MTDDRLIDSIERDIALGIHPPRCAIRRLLIRFAELRSRVHCHVVIDACVDAVVPADDFVGVLPVEPAGGRR